jgi:hypothetical protein
VQGHSERAALPSEESEEDMTFTQQVDSQFPVMT